MTNLTCFKAYDIRGKLSDISMKFKDEEGKWRFNLHSSNTEPVVRLNEESAGNIKLMNKTTVELLTTLRK